MMDRGDRLLSAHRAGIISVLERDDKFSCRALEGKLIKIDHSR
jgi:hypothetical protein